MGGWVGLVGRLGGCIEQAMWCGRGGDLQMQGCGGVKGGLHQAHVRCQLCVRDCMH